MIPVEMCKQICRAFLVLATATMAFAQETASFTGYVMTPFASPAVGANVTAIDCNMLNGEKNLRNRNIFKTVTDERGRFHFDALPLHEKRSPGGYRGFTITAELNDYAAAQHVGIEFKEFSQPMLLTLRESGYLEGIVSDAEGRPISEAWVWPYESYIGVDDPYPMLYVIGESAGRALSVQTDGSGKFRIGPVPVSARKWGVHAAHVDYSSARAGAYELGQDNIEVVLARGSTVHGRVVNAVDGSPLPNVFIVHPGWLATIDGGAYTDDEGAFSLSGVREGLHSFPFTIVDDRRMIRVERTSVVVDGVNDVSNYEMRFAPSASISGRVIDVSTGEGVADTHVVATGMAGQDQSPATVSTDKDGYYELVGVPTGSVAVFVRAAWGYLRTDPEAAKLWDKTGLQYYYMNPVGDVELIEVVQGEVYEDVDLKLDSKTVVRGRVVDDNGAPVANATVIGWPPLKQDNDHHGFDNVSDESMADGSFELRGLSDKDDVYLVVRAPGFLGADTGPLAINESLPEQTLSLIPGGGKIHGTFAWDGALQGGVRVECKRIDYDPPLEVIVFTNPQGEFSIDALPRGPYKVRAYWTNGGSQEIELKPDAPTAEIHFSGENKTRRFRGIVTLDGEPYTFGDLEVTYERHRRLGKTTNADGEFTVPFFEPKLTITAYINDGPLYQQQIRHTVTAEPGEEVSARFDFVTPSKSP